RNAEDRNSPFCTAAVSYHRQAYQASRRQNRGSPQEGVSDDQAGDDDPAESTDDNAHQGAPESGSPPDSGGHRSYKASSRPDLAQLRRRACDRIEQGSPLPA